METVEKRKSNTIVIPALPARLAKALAKRAGRQGKRESSKYVCYIISGSRLPAYAPLRRAGRGRDDIVIMDQSFAQTILEKNTRDYDTIAVAFSETRGFAGETIQLFADQISDGSSVLDVGCGNGRFLDAFVGRNIDYTGLDVSSRMIAQAEARNKGVQIPHRFIVGDMLALSFSDATFDTVIEVSALHHIPSDVLRLRAIREFARVLKPGGRLFLTDWNLWQPRMIYRYRLWNLVFDWALREHDRRDVYVRWKRGVDQPIERYIHVFSLREVRDLVEGVGLSIEQQYYSLQGKPAHWWNGHRLVTVAKK